MALSKDIIPVTLNINPQYSVQNNAVFDTAIVKIVPKDSTGAIYDFTSATVVSLSWNNNTQDPVAGTNGSLSVTTFTGDATGLKMTLPGSLWGSLNSKGTKTFPMSCTVSDGTNTVTAATGIINISLVG